MNPPRKRIAIIGSGISGLASGYFLNPKHGVVLFGAAGYPGGHTNTVDVTLEGRCHGGYTGFLVYNQRTDPNTCGAVRRAGQYGPVRQATSCNCRRRPFCVSISTTVCCRSTAARSGARSQAGPATMSTTSPPRCPTFIYTRRCIACGAALAACRCGAAGRTRSRTGSVPCA